MKDRLRATMASVAVITLGIAGVAWAQAPSGVDPAGCRPGVVIELYEDGTYLRCEDPTPTPSPSTSPTVTTQPPATTPPPSPSPTAPVRLTNCLPRLAVCGYPHPGNTGVPAGTTLTPYTGPEVITTPGTVIDGKAITKCIYVQAIGVTIRRSSIVAAGCHGNVSVDSGTATLEDVTIDCVDQRGTGIDNQNFIARRVRIDHCQNGFDVYGSNVLIVDSYITGIAGGDGHGDGLQMNYSSNITIRHNTFDLTQNITSSLILGFEVTNLLVENNFVMSGSYAIYCSRENTNSVYRGNRFYAPYGGWQTDGHRSAYGFTTNCVDPGITWTGNYRDDTLGVVNAA